MTQGLLVAEVRRNTEFFLEVATNPILHILPMLRVAEQTLGIYRTIHMDPRHPAHDNVEAQFQESEEVVAFLKGEVDKLLRGDLPEDGW